MAFESQQFRLSVEEMWSLTGAAALARDAVLRPQYRDSGLFMANGMADFNQTVDIAAPRHRVWTVMSDIEHWGRVHRASSVQRRTTLQRMLLLLSPVSVLPNSAVLDVGA